MEKTHILSKADVAAINASIAEFTFTPSGQSEPMPITPAMVAETCQYLTSLLTKDKAIIDHLVVLNYLLMQGLLATMPIEDFD